ncbi:MAG: hypothetical protein KDI55_24975 [Anaerolineae bacterium]|nr:hypothetical protein [Anaerolineae bacterium]
MNTAKCPHCGYKHPTYLKPDDFPATLVALNGGHVPTMCDACSALPWEYAERVPRFYGDEGRSRVGPTPYEFRLRPEADARQWPEIAPFVTLYFSDGQDAEALALAMLAECGGSVQVSDTYRRITIEYPNAKPAAATDVADTGYLEACAACGAGVRVYRHHTVDLEGYLCPSCGHGSARKATMPPVERDYWSAHEQVTGLLETLQAAVDQHAEAATQEGIHYGHVGSLGYIRQTLDEIQQAFRPQPVDCAPAAAR